MAKFGEKQIHAEEVANYLNQNREFFHIFPGLLDGLSIPHPKSGKAISLLERQLYQLREQRDGLQIEIDTLKNIAGENGQLLHKVYDFSYALMAAEDEQEAVNTLFETLDSIFAVEHVALVSWEVPSVSVQGFYQLGISQAWSKSLKDTLVPETPVCGLLEDSWQKGLFQTREPMKSVCVLPLGKDRVWGVLALGATTDRFSPELGTYFLKIMGSLVTARLQRLFS